MIPRTASYQVCSLFFQVTTCFSLNPTSEHEHFDHFLFLANYVPSSRPWGVLSFTQRFFQI